MSFVGALVSRSGYYNFFIGFFVIDVVIGVLVDSFFGLTLVEYIFGINAGDLLELTPRVVTLG